MTDSVSVHRNPATKLCICGGWFTPKRSTGKYCSDACRQTAKRDRDVLWQRVRTIEQLLDEIVRTQHPDQNAALRRVNRAIKERVMFNTPPGKELVKSIKEYMES